MSYNVFSVIAGEQPSATKWNFLGSNDAGFKDGSNLNDLSNPVILQNVIALRGKDIGGTARDIAKITADDEIHIGKNDEADHTVINAGTSKLVKIKVLRQDNITNSYEAISVFLTGWGFVTGDGAVDEDTKTVTFGVTFDELPIVLCDEIDTKTGSDPTDLDDFTNAPVENKFSPNAVTVDNFVAHVVRTSRDGADPGNLTSGRRYGFTWLAVGQLT